MMLKIFDLHSTSNLRGKGNRNKNDFWSTAWTSCCHAVNSNFKDPDQLKKIKKKKTYHLAPEPWMNSYPNFAKILCLKHRVCIFECYCDHISKEPSQLKGKKLCQKPDRIIFILISDTNSMRSPNLFTRMFFLRASNRSNRA